jgi:hypothetical protein
MTAILDVTPSNSIDGYQHFEAAVGSIFRVEKYPFYYSNVYLLGYGSYSSMDIVYEYSTDYKLTPWNRVLLDKLIVAQRVKTFFEFYRTIKSITVSITAFHCSILREKRIQSTPLNPTYLRSI